MKKPATVVAGFPTSLNQQSVSVFGDRQFATGELDADQGQAEHQNRGSRVRNRVRFGRAGVIHRAGADIPATVAIEVEVAAARRKAVVQVSQAGVIQGAIPRARGGRLRTAGPSRTTTKQVAIEGTARIPGIAGSKSERAAGNLLVRADAAARERAVVAVVITAVVIEQRAGSGLSHGSNRKCGEDEELFHK